MLLLRKHHPFALYQYCQLPGHIFLKANLILVAESTKWPIDCSLGQSYAAASVSNSVREESLKSPLF